MTLEILTDAHPLLHQVSEPVGEITDEVCKLADAMLATMYAARGIGLAAVQVGHPIRMLVMDAGGPEKPRPVVLIDPEIVWSKKTTTIMEEGCLSIPGLRIDVTRPSDVDVTFTGLDGVRVKRSFGGMPARIVQHEIDHLNGVLINQRHKA